MIKIMSGDVLVSPRSGVSCIWTNTSGNIVRKEQCEQILFGKSETMQTLRKHIHNWKENEHSVNIFQLSESRMAAFCCIYDSKSMFKDLPDLDLIEEALDNLRKLQDNFSSINFEPPMNWKLDDFIQMVGSRFQIPVRIYGCT